MAYFAFRFVETHYEQVRPLFEADPLLLPVFIRVCPKAELSILFKKIPVTLALSWLVKLARDCFSWRDEVQC